jgi:transposase
VLDHRRFWEAMHAVTLEQMEEISRAIAVRIVEASGVDCSSVALDMTNFASFIDSANGKAPIAQRGKATQKRSDLRLIGLGLVVTRDGGIPLTWHARRLSLLRPWTRRSAELTQFAHPAALCGRIRLTCTCTFPVAAL